MHAVPPRTAYPRELYPPPPPSAAFIRERILSTYTVPDPRVCTYVYNVIYRYLYLLTSRIFLFYKLIIILFRTITIITVKQLLNVTMSMPQWLLPEESRILLQVGFLLVQNTMYSVVDHLIPPLLLLLTIRR